MTTGARKRKLTIADIFGVRWSRFKVGAMAHISTGKLGVLVCALGWAYDITMRRGYVKDLNKWIIAQAHALRNAGYMDWGMNLLFAENGRLDDDFDLILQIKPRWVTISAVATPDDFRRLPLYAQRLRDAGIYYGLLVGSYQHLRLLLKKLPQELWPNFVILEGCESGGHNGPCSLLELLATCLAELKKTEILVGAAGNVTPELAKNLFAMGVDFIQIGSPVAISEESPAHPRYKDAVCRASTTVQTGTGRYQHSTRGIPTRGALWLLGLEHKGVDKETFIAKAGKTIQKGILKGSDRGVMLIGDGVRGYKRVRPLATILGEYTQPEERTGVA